MKAADGNGYAYKRYCLKPVVDETTEGPALAICGTPLPAHDWAQRKHKDTLCRSHHMSKLVMERHQEIERRKP